jgi:hypothetical protein
MKTIVLSTENRKLTQLVTVAIGVPLIQLIGTTQHLQSVEVAGLGLSLFAAILLVYVLHEASQ